MSEVRIYHFTRSIATARVGIPCRDVSGSEAVPHLCRHNAAIGKVEIRILRKAATDGNPNCPIMGTPTRPTTYN